MKRLPDHTSFSEEDRIKRRQGTDNATLPIVPNNFNGTLVSSDEEKTVFMINNVPADVTLEDLELLVSPFVRDIPFRIMLQPATHSALIDAHTPQQAAAAIEYFNIHTLYLKGAPIKATSPEKNLKLPTGELRVLLVTVTNLRFSVDIDLIYRLFSVYGSVEKIVTFSKPPSRFQALIQFANARQARDAITGLNNKCIYDTYNTLQIQTSKLTELVVKGNNSRSWDFTIAPAKGATQPIHYKTVLSSGTHDFNDPHLVGLRTSTAIMTLPPPDYHSVIAPAATTAVWNNHNVFSQTSSALNSIGYNTPLLNANQAVNLGFPSRLLTPTVFEKLPRELQNSTTLRQINPSGSCVVICYNLPTEEITIQKLFNLLSLYGVVSRIKILRDKPNTALVQYSDSFYATLACHFLANAPFFGSGGTFQIGISKKSEVKMPSRLSTDIEESKRTMAFSLRDQRCGTEEVEKFIRGACKPTATLFIANIHDSIKEEELRQLLSTIGTVVKLEMRPLKELAKKLTAMAEMASERDALSAICHLHNFRLHDSNLKLAFSKQILTSPPIHNS